MSGKEGKKEDGQAKDDEEEGEEGSEDDEDEDDENAHRCEPCEDPPIIMAKSPYSPTHDEKEKHNATHLPYRSWCPVCVQAKGKEDDHKKAKKDVEENVETIVMDYKAFGHDEDDDAVTAIVMRAKKTGMTAAHVCTVKGPEDKWIIKKLVEATENWGYTKIILKTDGEPALVRVAEEVKKARSHETIPQSPPAYDPAANGAAEHAVQDVMGQIRAIKIGLEQRTKTKISTNGPVVQWIVEHSTTTINIGLVGHDGKVPRQRMLGKTSAKPILEIGEQVLAKPLRAQKSNKKLSLRSKWVHATWLGIAARTNEHIVAIEKGGAAIRVRTVKRKPAEDRWSGEALAEIKATPRNPNPKDEKQEEPLPERLTKGANPGGGDGDQLPNTNTEEDEVRLRDFKITKKLVEKFGITPGCKGCEGQIVGTRRAHSAECRLRMEEKMQSDQQLSERIKERDRRIPKDGEGESAEADIEMPGLEVESEDEAHAEVKSRKKVNWKDQNDEGDERPEQKKRRTSESSSRLEKNSQGGPPGGGSSSSSSVNHLLFIQY